MLTTHARLCRSHLAYLVMLGLVAAPAARAQWEGECSAPAAMPDPGGDFTPIPLPGTWKISGLGNSQRFTLVVEECGERLEPGGAGVRLDGGLRLIPLDRTRAGDYEASETYTEDGYSLTVSWRLTPESRTEMSGTLKLFRPRDLELRYLEGTPYQQAMQCECDAVRRKRDQYVRLREGFQGAGASSGDRDETNREVDEAIEEEGGEAVTEWATNVRTCSIRKGDIDEDYPSEETFEIAARSGWDHERVHRDRCCEMSRTRAEWESEHPELERIEAARLVAGLDADEEATYQRLLAERPPTYAEWSENGANDALDEIEGYDAGIATLDDWLAEHCS